MRNLQQELADLPAVKLEVVASLMGLLKAPISMTLLHDSDVIDEQTGQALGLRMLIHHALTQARLHKKSAEYALVASARAAGKSADLIASSVHAGADLSIGSERISLKTEGGKTISATHTTISKFQEARWLRECQQDDLAAAVRLHVAAHLKDYSRLLVLRAFEADDERSVTYELVEIPLTLLKRIEAVDNESFSPLTENHSSSASVLFEDGDVAFKVALDGSVEKVTLRSIPISACIVHAKWVVPMEQFS